MAQIRQQLDRRRFERLGVRALRVAGSPATWEQRLMAGLLDLGPQAVVSHRAAAALLGLDGFEPGPVEFTVPRSERHRVRGWTVHSTRRLDRIDRLEVGLLACTTASRTIVDLSASVRADQLALAIDSAVREGLTSPAFLGRRLVSLRGRGRQGVRLLQAVLEDAGGHTPLERAFLRLVKAGGLPRPTCQQIFRRDGKTIARVDFSFEPRPLVVEVSGRRGHSTDVERARDAHRRNELQSLGFVVLEFTRADVFERPAYVLQMLRRHLP